MAIVSEHRGAALAVLRLADFARLVGAPIDVPKPRRKRAPKRRKPGAQLSLFTPTGDTVHVVDAPSIIEPVEEPCKL